MAESAPLEVGLELEHAIGFTGTSTCPLHFHPAGQEMAYVSGACVVITDVTDPHKQAFLRGHDDVVSCMAMSVSGRYLVTANNGEKPDVVVWDWETRQLVYRMQEHDHGIVHVSMTDDERFLLTVGDKLDAKMVVWDLTTGCIVASKPNMEPTTCACWGGRKKNIKGRDTTDFVIATGGERALKIWTLVPSTGALTAEVVNTGNQVRNFTCLAFSPSRDYMYAASSSGDFSAAHVKNLMMHSVTQACSNGICSMLVNTAASGDDQLVVGGGDGTVGVFEGGGRSYRKAASVLLDGPVTALTPVSPAHGIYVAGTSRGIICRVDLSTPEGTSKLIQDNHYEAVSGVAYAPDDSSFFVTCSHDGTVRVWDVSDYSVSARGYCQTSIVGVPMCVAFTGEVIISGWRDGKMRAHDAENGELLWSIANAHRGGVTALQVSHNRKFVVSGGEEGEVRVWEIRTREMILHLKQHTMSVTSLCIFEDDSQVVTASRDRSILRWDLRLGQRNAALTQRMGGINSIVLMPDASQVLSVGQEKRVSFWELREPSPLQWIDVGSEQMCVCRTSDGVLFATGGDDHKVRVWHFESAKLVAEGIGHSRPIISLQFSHDDKQLVSVGVDGSVLLWNVYM